MSLGRLPQKTVEFSDENLQSSHPWIRMDVICSRALTDMHFQLFPFPKGKVWFSYSNAVYCLNIVCA